MKKIKIFSLLLLLFLIISCKTLPFGTSVKAVDLLDNENTLYLIIPVQSNLEFVSDILRNTKKISEDDIKKITKKIDVLYIGANNNNFQIAASTHIKSKMIPLVLNEKNGWTIEKSQTYSNIKIYKNNMLEVSFPSNTMMCAGKNVEKMISNLDNYNKFEYDESLNLDSDVRDFLLENSSYIRFYAKKSKSVLNLFLTNIIDFDMIDNVSGVLKDNPKNNDEFLSEIIIEFNSEKFAKLGKSILKMGLGGSNIEIESIGKTKISIKNLKLNKYQIYNNIKL